MNAPTYKETVHRYRIFRHEDLPEEHKAEYRLNDIDPDHNWSLIWSFIEKEAAIEQLKSCRENAPWWQTYRMIDAGKEEVIERIAWI